MDLTTRVNLVRNLSTSEAEDISISEAAKLIGVSRTSIYYQGREISEDELASKSIIDHLHTENPTWGGKTNISSVETQRVSGRPKESPSLYGRDGH